MSEQPGSFLACFAAALLASDRPDLSAGSLSAAGEFVVARHRRMPTLLRYGVDVIGGALSFVCSIKARGSFRRAPLDRRVRVADAVGAMRLPLVGEYVRMARGLALASVYESGLSGVRAGAS